MKALVFLLFGGLLILNGYSQAPSFKNKNELFRALRGKWNFQAGESDTVKYVLHRTNYGQAYINFIDTTLYEFPCRSSVGQLHQMSTCKEKWFFKDHNVIRLQRGSILLESRIEKLNANELVLILVPITK